MTKRKDNKEYEKRLEERISEIKVELENYFDTLTGFLNREKEKTGEILWYNRYKKEPEVYKGLPRTIVNIDNFFEVSTTTASSYKKLVKQVSLGAKTGSKFDYQRDNMDMYTVSNTRTGKTTSFISPVGNKIDKEAVELDIKALLELNKELTGLDTFVYVDRMMLEAYNKLKKRGSLELKECNELKIKTGNNKADYIKVDNKTANLLVYISSRYTKLLSLIEYIEEHEGKLKPKEGCNYVNIIPWGIDPNKYFSYNYLINEDDTVGDTILTIQIRQFFELGIIEDKFFEKSVKKLTKTFINRFNWFLLNYKEVSKIAYSLDEVSCSIKLIGPKQVIEDVKQTLINQGLYDLFISSFGYNSTHEYDILKNVKSGKSYAKPGFMIKIVEQKNLFSITDTYARYYY